MVHFKEGDKPRWLKSKAVPLTFMKEQIDYEAGIIRDVVMCEVGEAKGHNLHLEQEFIDTLVDFDVKNYSKTGVKARFGHPAMSDTTMGKQMGMFKNCRVRDNQAIADLQLLDSANLSPSSPGMKDWMLSMADEAPSFVMCSIVFSPGGYYQRNEKNEKRYCFYYKEFKDENGDAFHRWIGDEEELGNVYVEMGEHYYTDMVEAGAATNNLFSQQFNSDKFAVRAIEWVQENADIHQFLQKNPDKLVDFANQLGVELPKPKVQFSDKWKAFRDFFMEVDVPEGENDMEATLTRLEKSFEVEKVKLLSQVEIEKSKVLDIEVKFQTQSKTVTDLKTEKVALQEELDKLRERIPEKPSTFQKNPPTESRKNEDTFFKRVNNKVQASYNRSQVTE